MERLTKMIAGYPHGAEGITKEKLTGMYCRGEFEATACVEKLAEYEDLEKQGRLVKLPCEVGDTIYVKIGTDVYINLEVLDFGYHNSCGFYIVCGYYNTPKCAIPLSDFGKNFFLKNPQA